MPDCDSGRRKGILPAGPATAPRACTQRWPKLSADLPLHSFAFFTLSSDDDALPARVKDTYDVIRWQDAHVSGLGPVERATRYI